MASAWRANLFLITVTLLWGCSLASAQERDKLSPSYAKYKGAWFTIDYPAGWKVRPSLTESQPDGAATSAFFTAPNKSAEFYVFSPLWNGNPKDIAFDPKREVLVSQHRESAPHVRRPDGSFLSNTAAHWYNVRARDNSYLRSWVDVENKDLNVRHVFGIKYRNIQTYQKFRVQYVHFCKSLEQFSN